MKNVGPLPLNTPGTVVRKVKSVHRLIATHCPGVPELGFEKPLLLQDYCGDGYGWPTPAGNRAIQIFREREGIALDPVYTGKTCAALLDFIGHALHRTRQHRRTGSWRHACSSDWRLPRFDWRRRRCCDSQQSGPGCFRRTDRDSCRSQGIGLYFCRKPGNGRCLAVW